MALADLDLIDSLIDTIDRQLLRAAVPLPDPVSEHELERAEEFLGHPLPVEVRHFYRRHDGYRTVPVGGPTSAAFVPAVPVQLACAVGRTRFARRSFDARWDARLIGAQAIERQAIESQGAAIDLDRASWSPSLFAWAAVGPDPVVVDGGVPPGHQAPVIRLARTTWQECFPSFTEMVATWCRCLDRGRTAAAGPCGRDAHDELDLRPHHRVLSCR